MDFRICTVVAAGLMLAAKCQNLDIDKSNWIDPTDMLNYDTVKRVMKKPVEERVESRQSDEHLKIGASDERGVPNKNCNAEVQKYEELTKKLQEYEKKLASLQQDDETITYKEEMPYMKRYVNQLINHFSADSSVVLDYRVSVQLTVEDKKVLSKFIKGDKNNLQDVDDILSRFIVFSETMSPQDVNNSKWATAMNFEFLIIAVILCAAWLFMLKASVFKCALLFVLISTFWHWKHLYQQAVARRDAELAKLSDIPSECRPTEPQSLFYKFMSLSLKKMFGRDADSCEKYYKAMVVDPIWEVSPSLAFSEAISQFVTHPFGILGSNIGSFYYNLNENLPWFSYYILLFATLVFAFFALVAIFGYRIRLPFGIVSIEPAPATARIQTSPPAQAVTQAPQVRQAVEDVVGQSDRRLAHEDRQTVAPRAICASCQQKSKLILDEQLTRPKPTNVASHGGAGDQGLPLKRENLQEIEARWSTDHDKVCHTPPHVAKETGDISCVPPSPLNPDKYVAQSQMSPQGTKFVSDLCNVLKEDTECSVLPT